MEGLENFIHDLTQEIEENKKMGIDTKLLSSCYDYLFRLYNGHNKDISVLVDAIRNNDNCKICAIGNDKTLCSLCKMCDKRNHFVYRDLMEE